VVFLILIWFVNRYLWGPLTSVMEQRQKRIADGLAAAEKGQHEKELAEQRAKEELAQAKEQAAEIIAQAQKRSNEIVEEAKESAREEGERLKAAAQSEIEQEVNRAREQLRSRVAELSTTGASRILKREIDASAHEDLISDLVTEI
jgi:F-type H+-transporting ATPase subunit b